MGVWGSSGSDVYAVGGNAGALLHYNGMTWSPAANAPVGSWGGLWGSSKNDLYVSAGSGIYRFNGANLSVNALGLSFIPLAIWGTAAHEVYAVGTDGVILQGFRGATVALSPDTPTLTVGTVKPFSAEARTSGGALISGATFSWNSSMPLVATVDANGVVTAMAAGNTTITATAPGGASASTPVTVSP
jgi:hypothetical protein